MSTRIYSQRLGPIADEQFQSALNRFDLGKFLRAEPIPFGNFGQNVFVSSDKGEFVLRGQPHFWWQFPTEQFYTRLLHERTDIPVPWPYLIDSTTDIFGWSFVLMPRMSGLQLADPDMKAQLTPAERLGIAHALGDALARMQQITWPFAGRYNPTTQQIEPFDLKPELAWPLPVEVDPSLTNVATTRISYSQLVKSSLNHNLQHARYCNPDATTLEDIAWVADLINKAQDVLNDEFEPCLLMEDYKEGNLVVTKDGDETQWRVSGVFDLMTAHFGDGEADLARQFGEYIYEDITLAREFLNAYQQKKTLRPGFKQRFPIYILLDRSILWEFFQSHQMCFWDESWTFRDWAGWYLDQLKYL